MEGCGKRTPSVSFTLSVEVLQNLEWTWDGQGRFIKRRDAYGVERIFELGVDSFEVIVEWLRDVHRRRCLAKCGRVVKQLHRGDAGDDVAQGLVLPGPPPDCLATFEGHKWAWRQAKDTTARHCALVTGCSYWHKRRKAAGCRATCSKVPLWFAGALETTSYVVLQCFAGVPS